MKTEIKKLAQHEDKKKLIVPIVQLVAVAFFGLFAFGGNKLNEAQTQQARSLQLDDKVYLDRACNKKAECAKEKEIMLSCANAGDIDRCIRIKIQGKVANGDCEAVYSNSLLEPTTLQCIRPTIKRLFVSADSR